MSNHIRNIHLKSTKAINKALRVQSKVINKALRVQSKVIAQLDDRQATINAAMQPGIDAIAALVLLSEKMKSRLQ